MTTRSTWYYSVELNYSIADDIWMPIGKRFDDIVEARVAKEKEEQANPTRKYRLTFNTQTTETKVIE